MTRPLHASCRVLSLSALLVMVAGCSNIPLDTLDLPGDVLTPRGASFERPLISPNTAFPTCRPVVIDTEDPDAPLTADPAPRRRTHLVAEYAGTAEERHKGLQGRTDLHPHTAMLLSFDGSHNPVLWMKDTPASLDMIFITSSGEVFHIESGTTPNSTEFLTPEEAEPVATHVLEVPAGVAYEMNILPGVSRIEIGPQTPCSSFSGT